VRSGSDPHRVLGVPDDAPEAEIKRAYRALAKRHHPDGGQGSIARFLEIQAAYETLVGDGRPGSPMGQDGQVGTTPRSSAAWRRRSRPTGTRSSNPGTATGGNPNTGRPRPAADPTRPRRGSGRRRASLGSTSYDDAEEVFEPGWGGASWYGPSSGTYWTLNPREYADPRKHGPEYQARATRPVAAEPASWRAGVEPPEQTTAQPDDAATEPAAQPAPGPAAAEPPARGRPSAAARILRVWRRGTIRP
jgi:curved DNA-binding protein CbpA